MLALGTGASFKTNAGRLSHYRVLSINRQGTMLYIFPRAGKGIYAQIGGAGREAL